MIYTNNDGDKTEQDETCERLMVWPRPVGTG